MGVVAVIKNLKWREEVPFQMLSGGLGPPLLILVFRLFGDLANNKMAYTVVHDLDRKHGSRSGCHNIGIANANHSCCVNSLIEIL